MIDAILKLNDISISYGRVEAVRRVSMLIERGSIVTIIGANGAGKTTLLKGIMGLLPLRGSIEFVGKPLKRMEVERRVAAGMSLVPERRELFSTMCVEDNLQLGAFPLSDAESADRLADIYGRFPRLKERRLQQAGTLSGGERQMLAMGRALMAGPKLLMLDEPSLGLAPRIVSEVFRAIVELSGTGISILLVEQNARSALQVAHRAYVMELGEMVMSAPASELANDPRVIASYLGR